MNYVELRFPLIGAALPCDHGRTMFRAISRLIPEAGSAGWLLVKDVCGGKQCCEVVPPACLQMRLPQSRISLMLKLSSRWLRIGKHTMRLGTPEISLLEPSPSLYAKCVVINGCRNPAAFLNALALRLDDMGIVCEFELGRRRRFRAGRRLITGYALTLHDLSEESSMALQEQGMGNHRHLGCGFFVAVRKRLH